jgi:hypothetical protein
VHRRKRQIPSSDDEEEVAFVESRHKIPRSQVQRASPSRSTQDIEAMILSLTSALSSNFNNKFESFSTLMSEKIDGQRRDQAASVAGRLKNPSNQRFYRKLLVLQQIKASYGQNSADRFVDMMLRNLVAADGLDKWEDAADALRKSVLTEFPDFAAKFDETMTMENVPRATRSKKPAQGSVYPHWFLQHQQQNQQQQQQQAFMAFSQQHPQHQLASASQLPAQPHPGVQVIQQPQIPLQSPQPLLPSQSQPSGAAGASSYMPAIIHRGASTFCRYCTAAGKECPEKCHYLKTRS